ncbi:hypothetical protein [Methylomagnum ishizawai]|uniref:hypothetical protein n=1 Tax=Methylomagnum ishizawai TaxID=1760988 RepID=UPI000F735419|nr:hypothetical protein [Methylomagnum ishizawai]
MKIIVYNQHNEKILIPDAKAVPRHGDVIGVIFPSDNQIKEQITYPVVEKVYFWPTSHQLDQLGVSYNKPQDIEAIIYVYSGV